MEDKETFTVDGIQYKKLNRKFQASDYLYAIESGVSITKGKVYQIIATDKYGEAYYLDDGTNLQFYNDGKYPYDRYFVPVECISPPVESKIAYELELIKRELISLRMLIVDALSKLSEEESE